MKTIYDLNTKQELIDRINLLSEHAASAWGKMNVAQMVHHCVLWEEMMLGKITYDRQWVGRLFGKWLLKIEVKDDRPMRKNNPTIPALKPGSSPTDFARERHRWIQLLQEHDLTSNLEIVHPFFGKMTPVEVGYHVYKHTDHHLRQFNV
ncbi:MAG TPA: DinB family protein [Cyclobacteriaceae bacterium]|nr:DinB family protein [Cyclobacteriaceae bacterium]